MQITMTHSSLRVVGSSPLPSSRCLRRPLASPARASAAPSYTEGPQAPKQPIRITRDQLGRMAGGLLFAALSFSVPQLTGPEGGFGDLRQNVSFVAGFWAWLIAQVMKVFTYRYKRGEWNFKALVDSGGMPSSHSSMCMGVTTAVALQHGFSSALFSVALCFSLIVMYDAAGVRRHAGSQAQVLNVVVQELMAGHPISERELKEVLGHTPLQVFMGALLGILSGIMVAGRPF